MQRFGSILAALMLFGSILSVAAQAEAMTTQQERTWGRGVARSIVAQQGTLDDALLNRWVNRVGSSLASHSVRGDLPYTFTIIDSEEVNAFSVPGGYIFVDAGLLNFVHSDDELAAVLGHEIGHVERRHVVTLTQKAKALEIILDVAGIFAPGISRFGNLAGNLTLYKMARVDELQADQYGLMLMSQAGYDPEAMVSFLTRLGEDSPHAHRQLKHYFETHPALPDRVAHLKGYGPLDRPSNDALLAQAIHAERSGEYFTARGKLQRIGPASTPLAQEYQRRMDAVFGAAQLPRGSDGRASNARADAASDTAPQTLKTLLALARRDRDSYEKLLDSLDYSVDPQSLQNIADGSHLFRILAGQIRAGRYFDHSFDQIAQTLVEVSDTALAAQRLLGADTNRPSKARSLAIAANEKTVQAVLAARGAVAVGWQSASSMRRFLDDFDAVSNYKGGDMHTEDYRRLRAPLRDALIAARRAATAANVAAGLINAAKADLVLAHLDAFESLDRVAGRASFDRLLQQRFGVSASDVDQAARLGIDAGDTAVASIVAAESDRSLTSVIMRMRMQDLDAAGFALTAGIRPETLQLELGLVWTSYSDGTL